MDPSIFKAITDFGVAIVALVALSLFAFWMLRTTVDDLRKSRDRSLDISERQVAATEKLTESVRELVSLVRDRAHS